MSQELSVSLFCIVIRQGAQIWIEESKLTQFDSAYQQARTNGGLIQFDGERFSPADVVGVFSAQRMDEMTRRKNGQWMCEKAGEWHDRGQKCECTSKETRERNEAIEKAKAECTLCTDPHKGFKEVTPGGALMRCRCIVKFFMK